MNKSLSSTDKPVYLHSINKKIRENKRIDRAFGRRNEISRLTQIILRRTKSNPILLGDAGVGKTAIVEELAHMIEDKTAHSELHDYEIFELDLNALIAGSKERGEYEDRVKDIIDELQEDNTNKILLIDEIHNITKNSNSKSSNTTNISDLLKPALARGTIKCIGATTYDEYTKYFMKDAALDRRFTPIEIKEPNAEETIEILNNIKHYYEDFHKCIFDYTAIVECVIIAEKYIHYRNFPDKAIDLLDEVGSHNAMLIAQNIKTKTEKVYKEDVITFAIEHLQIKVEQMNESTTCKIKNIKEQMESKILGQNNAIKLLTNCLLRKECSIYNNKRPIATFLFYGKSGTGKSELAKILGTKYYDSFIRLDMSEYMESYSISSLIGSPPGYIGYDEAGILTNAIKRNPYTIILFDEIEKAHPNVYNLLLQIMEDGILHDNQGKKYNFSNAIIIMTSNAGYTESSNNLGFQLNTDYDPYDNSNTAHDSLKSYFRPEFLNRIDEIIKFNELSDESLYLIAYNNIKDKLDFINTNNDVINIYYDDKIMMDYVDYIMKMDTSKCPRSIKSNIEHYITDTFVDIILEINS